MTSPTTALAGQRPSSTMGKTSVTGIRPISENGAGCGAAELADGTDDVVCVPVPWAGASVGAAEDLEGRVDCFLPAIGVVFGVTGTRLR